jgi:hypothetical protein
MTMDVLRFFFLTFVKMCAAVHELNNVYRDRYIDIEVDR